MPRCAEGVTNPAWQPAPDSVTTATTTVLEALNLRCQRGDRHLFDALQCSVSAGRLLRVEGPNGSGKTSLLRLLAGLAAPAAGSVTWHGQPIARQREAFAHSMLYLGHPAALKDELSAVENLQADARLRGLPTSDDGAIAPALQRLGLGGRALRLPVRLLSAGQRRRASLARLLLGRAPLWILDEPFTALDADGIAVLGGVIGQHLVEGGMAIVTTHQDVPIAARDVARLRLQA